MFFSGLGPKSQYKENSFCGGQPKYNSLKFQGIRYMLGRTCNEPLNQRERESGRWGEGQVVFSAHVSW
jgi:hypothetical protein